MSTTSSTKLKADELDLLEEDGAYSLHRVFCSPARHTCVRLPRARRVRSSHRAPRPFSHSVPNTACRNVRTSPHRHSHKRRGVILIGLFVCSNAGRLFV
jgi:hypothetical protein